MKDSDVKMMGGGGGGGYQHRGDSEVHQGELSPLIANDECDFILITAPITMIYLM